MSHERFMERALELGRQGAWSCTPNPMVGCVIAADGEIVGEGFHRVAGGPHAEIEALGQAGSKAAGATMYVTLEPCVHQGRTPPCVDAVVAAGLAQVCIAMEDPDPRVQGRGVSRLTEAGIQCQVGICEEQARKANRGFVSRIERCRPWVRLKTASTLDGRIALADGSSKWITSKPAREEVHRMRAASCAVMTGIGTALADDPQLTARDVGVERQPLKVLVDSKLRCRPDLRMLAGDALVATAAEPPAEGFDGLAVVSIPDAEGRVDLHKLLETLAQDHQINYLLVEAGGGLVGALLEHGLIDEIAAFVAPKYFGSGKSVASFGPLESLEQAHGFAIVGLEQVGDDALITMERA